MIMDYSTNHEENAYPDENQSQIQNQHLFPKNPTKNVPKSVSFCDVVDVKIVERYIDPLNPKPKNRLTKRDLLSALNIIRVAIQRGTFKEVELKLVVAFHNKINQFLHH